MRNAFSSSFTTDNGPYNKGGHSVGLNKALWSVPAT